VQGDEGDVAVEVIQRFEVPLAHVDRADVMAALVEGRGDGFASFQRHIAFR